ncbi:hypothetical protein NUKP18_55480 [Klebsiella variicola]|nr:hypothetical protein NUKP18_55480 [Klebsiella variicola]GKM45452.1 hypothetical protein NUKP66_49900 [Klebsiella variicola]GKM66710.1 hypothetical protein NUKP67_51000 [Klebsiella variicola]
MCGGGEGATGDLCEESGCGPDTDSGHAGQDRVKRVGEYPLLYLKGHLVSLLTQCDELECQAWEDDDSSIRARNDDGLLGQCLADVSSKALSQTGREFVGLGCQFFLSQRSEFFGRGISLEQIEYGRVIQSRSENALQSRMYLGQQTTDTVAGLRGLRGKIIIEAAEHGELGDVLVSHLQRA